ncbi:MAG TPA: tripartite tricarboxylate transporter substrate binding protein [Burkholderiales bacterium]|jgi:tripartite-type tricarboxylate transporter receptor subunit TctC|nr:tripartite tricarboxylate transporter substrate binding protein [Burkholderiales bacterium]
MKQLAAALLALTSWAAIAQAPAWPVKPVHIVVSLTPGSATDILARTASERLSAQLGQPVIVENRPGASTTIAAAFVAKADPDGYTLLATSSAHTVAPFLYPGLSYDTARDLAGVAPLANLPTVLVVPPSKGFRTLADLVAAAHAKPGSINFGSAAASTQLNAERFRRSAKMEAVHIPFKGAPEALTEVVAGRLDFYFSPIAPALPLLREGKVQALAVGSSKRASILPELPTTIEAGFPDSDYNFWVGLFAPAKTPGALIERLHRATTAALQSQEVRERLPKLGAEPMTMTSGEFDALVREELRTNAVLVKAAGIQPN